MSKKKPCGLDYCPQEEIVGVYASCTACAWGNYDAKKRMGNNVAEKKNDDKDKE